MTTLTIRIVLLWLVISVNIMGGAILFKRFFPRESPWFGFILPELGLIILLNFIEHMVALPSLLLLAPIGTLGSLWLIMDPGTKWRGLRLPAGIFFAAFTFALILRALRPDIAMGKDSISDLALLSDYCAGETIPPTDCWLPPFKDRYYYSFLQYGGSVVTRLLNLDTGTGFNLSSALVSAYTCLIAAGAAWRLSRGKVWVTIAMAAVIQCAASGSSAFLWLTSINIDALASSNPFRVYDYNPYVKAWFIPIGPYDQPELMVPGSWSWTGSLHPTTGGQYLVLLSVWSMVEMLTKKRSNLPWICAATIPLVGLVASTWCVPMVSIFFFGAIGLAWYYRWRPRNLRHAVIGIAVVTMLMMPTLLEFLTTNLVPGLDRVEANQHTQPLLIALQWWPILIPWLLLCFIWHRLPPAVRWVHFVIPCIFVFMEFYSMSDRGDMTGKFWGYIYGAGLIAFFPVVASRKEIVFRVLTGILLLSSLLSLGYWSRDTWQFVRYEDLLHIEGTGGLRMEESKARLFQVVAGMSHKTLIQGRCGWTYSDCPMLGSFTENRTYVTGSNSQRCGYVHGETIRREAQLLEFYDGKMKDPLTFLRSNDIEAVVIWPGDNIENDALESLKKQLTPTYEYLDFRDFDAPNVGIFVYHATMDNRAVNRP